MKHVVTTKKPNDIEITKQYFASRCLKYIKNCILDLLSKMNKKDMCRKKQKLIKYKTAL